MKFLGMVVLLAVLVLLVLMNTPAELSYAAGTRPESDAYDHACPADEPGMENCSTVTSFRWRLASGATADTTLRVSRDDVSSLTGVMNLAGARCPDASVAWELTVGRQAVDGVLTGRDRSAELNVAVAEPLSEVRLRLSRTDEAGCVGEFRWDEPDLDVPAFSLPF